MTRTERVAAYLRERPGQWVDGLTLAGLGGAYGWRTRVSEARVRLGMDIENRQVKVGDAVRSEYRYRPDRLF